MQTCETNVPALDYKTVVLFASASSGQNSNERSGASVETARENGERRFAYIEVFQNYPFFQQRKIPIGLILTQPFIKC